MEKGLVKIVCTDHRGSEVIIISPSTKALIPTTQEDILQAKNLARGNYRELHPSKETMNHVVGQPCHQLYFKPYGR